MEIALQPYERRLLESLEERFQLEREVVVGFAQSLSRLCQLFENVVLQGDAEFRQGRVAITGFINHTHHLLVGGLSALEQGNGHVWSACVRGLMETFGACVMIQEHPGAVTAFLDDRIRAGRLRAAAERGRPGLGADLERLNNIVHPSSRAILAAFQFIDTSGEDAHLQYGLRQADPHDGREGVIVLANLLEEIGVKLEQLAATSEVVNAGKILMIRSKPTEPNDRGHG